MDTEVIENTTESVEENDVEILYNEIKSYEIITDTLERISQRINERTKDGWMYEGISTCSTSTGIMYTVIMSKREPVETKLDEIEEEITE